MKERTQAVSQFLSWIHTDTVFKTNLSILVGVNVVAELLGKTTSKLGNSSKIPWWKQCIQTSTAELRRHIAQLQEWNKAKLSKYRVKEDLERKYYVKNIGCSMAIKNYCLKRLRDKVPKMM